MLLCYYVICYVQVVLGEGDRTCTRIDFINLLNYESQDLHILYAHAVQVYNVFVHAVDNVHVQFRMKL
jgi:hypothetical protein